MYEVMHSTAVDAGTMSLWWQKPRCSQQTRQTCKQLVTSLRVAAAAAAITSLQVQERQLS